jgi:TonB family protein
LLSSWEVRCLTLAAQLESPQRRLKIALLDFGESKNAFHVTDVLAKRLQSPDFEFIDRDLSRAAARGYGYRGSLNLSVSEARDLGAAIGCDFYILGDSQTLRRSPSTGSAYFESYASIFLVSARTGKLIYWQRPSFQAGSPEQAEQKLMSHLQSDDSPQTYAAAIRKAYEAERQERELAVERNTPIIGEASEETDDNHGTRNPRPYRRLKPAYPDSAAAADATGTVDVLADLDEQGEVTRVDIARWAGFGMDEAALATVKQMHFFPAMRDGAVIPIRVLLRYNFRRPAK